ncbi:MAG: hypothetical protein IJH45_01440 [Firmicutes bacterium]|nr:hypothetical protein [Bacillota bacterium]
MTNKQIREAIAAAGLKQWEVAEAYGIHEGNFCRLLRHELTEDQRQQVMDAIEQAKAKREGKI